MTQQRNKRRGATVRGALFQLLPTAALFILFTAVGVIHVTSRVMVVHVGYRLSALEQQTIDLVRDHERLKLELATLKNPARLERIAHEQLGMISPPVGGVISLAPRMVPAKAEASLRPQTPAKVVLANRTSPR